MHIPSKIWRKLLASALLLLAFPVFGQAQDKQLDSLYEALADPHLTHADQLAILNELGKKLANTQPDTAIYFLDQAISLGKERRDTFHIVKALNQKGIIVKDRYSLEEAMRIYQEALTLNEALKDTVKHSDILYNISTVYFDLKDFDKSLEAALKVIAIDSARHNEKGLSYTCHRLFEVYLNLGQLNEAKYYLDKSLAIREELNDYELVGYAYTGYSQYYTAVKDHEKVAEYAEKSLAIFDSLSHKYGLIMSHHNLGNAYLQQEKYALAKFQYQKGIELAEEYSYPYNTAKGFHGIAYATWKAKDYTSSIHYAKSAETIYDTLNELSGLSRVNSLIHSIYIDMGDFENALEAYKKHAKYKAELNQKLLGDKLNYYSVQLKTARKEAEILHLKSEQEKKDRQLTESRLLSYLFFIIFLLTAALALFTYRDFKKKKQYAGQLELEVAHKTRELALANQNLTQSNKELKLFYATMAHDLRYPLRRVQSNLGDLKKSVRWDYENLIGSSQRALHQLQGSFERLMKFFQLENEPLRLSDFEPHLLVEDIVEDLEEIDLLDNLKIAVGEMPNIRGDMLLIRQVFINLITNAVKFTIARENPLLKIHGEAEGLSVNIYFEDNGEGISNSIQEVLFNSFATEKKAGHAGIGIGLFIVKRIMEQHGGSVSVQNRPNGGARFVLCFERAGGAQPNTG